MSDKKDKILEKVRALLAKAEGTEFEGEAAVFRAKADELMANYAIEQWQLEAEPDQKGREPERRDVNVSWYHDPAYRHVYVDMWQMFLALSKHCRCKTIWWGGRGDMVPVLGLPADLDYFDMLFTHLQMQLVSQLRPDVKPGDTYIEALVRMKEAGMKWEQIGERLIKADLIDGPYTRNMGVKFTKDYTQDCEEQQRERKYINPKTYQRSFTEGFVQQVVMRLAEQKKDQAEKGGTGMELALRDISKILDEEAINQFGQPPRGRGLATHTSRDAQGYAAGHAAGRAANITGNPQRGVGGTRGELTS